MAKFGNFGRFELSLRPIISIKRPMLAAKIGPDRCQYQSTQLSRPPALLAADRADRHPATYANDRFQTPCSIVKDPI
jgi:hypothetical protein